LYVPPSWGVIPGEVSGDLPRRSPPWREEPVPQPPYRLHVQPFALKDDLAAHLILPVLEIAGHVHPADRLLAVPLVFLADDEIYVYRLLDPIVQMALVLYIKDFEIVALACPQVGIAALELHVDLFATRPAVVVLEFHLAVDAVVENCHRAKDLVGLARPRKAARDFGGRERRGTRRGEGFAKLGGGGMGLAELVGLFEN
jgi:hypothetical protein